MWYTEIILTNALRHVDRKSPIPRKHFWAIILFVDRNDINNLGPKGQPSKTILTLRRDASTQKAIYGMHRCPVQTNWGNEKKEQKNKRKIDCHVMHLKNSIKSKQESRRKKCWENNEKAAYTQIILLLQGITLQFRWLCLKWKMTIFHHPSLM